MLLFIQITKLAEIGWLLVFAAFLIFVVISFFTRNDRY